MTKFYSKITGGFYDDGIHTTMPADVKQITDQQWQDAITGQSQGMIIQADANGIPVAVAPALPPLASRQDTRWTKIKAERDRRKSSGVLVGTKWFHTDADSRIQQLGLVMMGAGLPANLQWKTLDASFVAMTPALAGQIFGAVAASDQSIFAVAETHRTAMLASAQPEAYVLTAGWPLAYGEIA